MGVRGKNVGGAAYGGVPIVALRCAGFKALTANATAQSPSLRRVIPEPAQEGMRRKCRVPEDGGGDVEEVLDCVSANLLVGIFACSV